MANNFRKTDIEASNSLTDFLITKMYDEKDTIQRILVLGNTGSFSIFPFLTSTIANTVVSEKVKLEAVSALRLIPNREVSALLDTLIQNKNNKFKRIAKEVIERL